MSKALNISVSHLNVMHTDDVSAISYDVHVGTTCRHKVVVKTTKKFKQSLKTKIAKYCKSRQK